MKEPANSPVPAIRFDTGTPRSKSTATTPIVFLPSTVMAKLQSSLSPPDHTTPQSLERGACGEPSFLCSVSGIGDPESTRT